MSAVKLRLTKDLYLIIFIAPLQGAHCFPYTRALEGHRPRSGLYPTVRPSCLPFPVQGMLRAPQNAYRILIECQVPFNNDCSNNNSLLQSLTALRLDLARDTNNHVKTTLPPSLNGLPGEAEIRYYVKVTVQRPAFYKENFRAVC